MSKLENVDSLVHAPHKFNNLSLKLFEEEKNDKSAFVLTVFQIWQIYFLWVSLNFLFYEESRKKVNIMLTYLNNI